MRKLDTASIAVAAIKAVKPTNYRGIARLEKLRRVWQSVFLRIKHELL